MVIQELRDFIAETEGENVILFDNPSFDKSIVGISDNCVVYDFDMMVEELMIDDDMSLEDAMEFIEFNTIRAIPYFNQNGNAPIVYYPIIREDFINAE